MRKKIFLVAFVTLLLATAMGQRISKITLSETGNLTAITFDLDESVALNLSQDGSIIDWGVDIYRGFGENFWKTLEIEFPDAAMTIAMCISLQYDRQFRTELRNSLQIKHPEPLGEVSIEKHARKNEHADRARRRAQKQRRG